MDYREFVIEVRSIASIEDLPEENIEILKTVGMTEEEILEGVQIYVPYQDEDVRIEGTVAGIERGYTGDVSLVTVHLTTEDDGPPPTAYVLWPDPLPTMYEGSEVVIWGKVVEELEVQDEVAPMVVGYFLTCIRE